MERNNHYTSILERIALILHSPKSRWNPFPKCSSIQHGFSSCKCLWNNHNYRNKKNSTVWHIRWNTQFLKKNIKEKSKAKKKKLPRVVSGFNPVIFLATSMGSTFARLHTEANAARGWFYDMV